MPNLYSGNKLKQEYQDKLDSKLIGSISVTSYHLWRKHLKALLAGKGAKFQKNEADYNGFISVPKISEEPVKKILTDFKTKNPETEYWW